MGEVLRVSLYVFIGWMVIMVAAIGVGKWLSYRDKVTLREWDPWESDED
jgi:hypothetical protein